MKAKKIIGRLLLAFVLVSVGFAIGKETTRRRMLSDSAESGVADVADGVVAYYMHAKFRCRTCNLVESMGKELVATEFADAVKDGRLTWRDVNFQENEKLASRYSVGGNMIIVAKFENGEETARKRLDRVMELANKREEYMIYVRQGIVELLGDSK